MSPFLVEGRRIFSMLRSTDLLRLLVLLGGVMSSACVNRFLHEAVYQDGVWQTSFFQEDEEELAPALQNTNLRVLYNLVNPQPITLPEPEVKESDNEMEGRKEVPTEKASESDEQNTGELADPVTVMPVSLKELALLYKITVRQGCYVTKDGICFFLRFKDNAKKAYDVIYRDITTSELDSLIRQVWRSDSVTRRR